MVNQMNRRAFCAAASAASASALLNLQAEAQTDARPNILWLTSEDNGPQLGCYGDAFADTPNIDRLAAQGVIYTNVWSNAPVCAPARTAIITGVYPPCTGSEHMRSLTRLPAFMKMFPCYLRDAGYYCSNNVKEDYNLEKTGQVWDESSNKAHWRNRKAEQPFFAVFNFITTHESQVRLRPHTLIHDPAKVHLPAFHPDMPEVRRDWAQYYDKMTEMDRQVGDVLKELEEDGLADTTIVFYYGDNGIGMPRYKRSPSDSGLHVPLVISIPERWKDVMPSGFAKGGKSDRLVGFVDLAPTVLSLAGIQPPDYMQGHAFLGKYAAPEPEYAFGFRGRMDERYDMARSVRDKRYIYIRNYMPHLIYGQHVAYMFQTPTTQVWKKRYEEGKLHPPQTYFWEAKPPEELYDLVNDPEEVNNLVQSADHREILQKFRKVQRDFARQIRDVGFLPEEEIHTRSEGSTPYEMGHDPAKYPIETIMLAADLASMNVQETPLSLIQAMTSPDSAVRYWAVMGILMRGTQGLNAAKDRLVSALNDNSPSVRVIAAQALGQYGTDEDRSKAISVLLELAPLGKNSIYISMLALNALDALGDKADRVKETMKALPTADPSVHERLKDNVSKLIEKITQ